MAHSQDVGPCLNHLWCRENGRETLRADARFLRAATILRRVQRGGYLEECPEAARLREQSLRHRSRCDSPATYGTAPENPAARIRPSTLQQRAQPLVDSQEVLSGKVGRVRA